MSNAILENMRNLAIIAHVDHGKTTLIDAILQQNGVFRDNQQIQERVMDSNNLEKERGITILAKCTAILYQQYKLNIVDTPGHADFGGEVERVLSMVDGVIVLVDAAEGPMPQTKFVLSKALALGLRPIVVINKIDRPDERHEEVLEEIFDLFVALNANSEQLDFPVLYASGRSGWAVSDIKDERKNLNPLLDKVIEYIPIPKCESEGNFSMLVSMIDLDPFMGRILIGKIYSGKLAVNQPVKVLSFDGTQLEVGRINRILMFQGIERLTVNEAQAGDIVIVAGLKVASVADTVCSPEEVNALPATPIDPPTMAVTVSVNNSPLAGREGTKVTSNLLRERLLKEQEGNVTIKIQELPSKDAFEVKGRGELQLGILFENMRREGFEFSVSRPRVLYREENGVRQEPIEEVVIDVDEEFSGIVVEKMSQRKAEMTELLQTGENRSRLKFLVPSRGLIGYHGQFLTDTRGTGIMNRLFHSYGEYRGQIGSARNGVLVSSNNGQAVAYAIFNLEDRGMFFISPGMEVYEGMIVGSNSRDNDLDVNPIKGKQLSNMRAAGKDEFIKLTPPKIMTLEEAIAFILDDELVEVTPKNIRLRKKFLNPEDRKRAKRTEGN